MSKTNLISLRASMAAFFIFPAAAIVPAAASAAPAAQDNEPAQAKLMIKPFGIHKGKAKITTVVSIGGSPPPAARASTSASTLQRRQEGQGKLRQGPQGRRQLRYFQGEDRHP